MNVKILNLFCYYIIPLALFIVYGSLYFYDISLAYSFSVLMGKFAFWLLSIILFMKPLKKVFPSFKLVRKVYYRKQLGVLSTYLFLAHFLGVYELLVSEPFVFSINNFLMWGLFGGIIFIILGATSSTLAKIKLNKLMNKGWKKLHRSAYLLYVFGVLHAYLVSSEVYYLLMLAIYVLLKALEFSGVRFTESAP